MTDHYAEFSPSRSGVHVLLRGNIPPGRRVDHDRGIEIYNSGRWFACTGAKLNVAPSEILNRSEQVAAVYDEFFKPEPVRPPSSSNYVSSPSDDTETAIEALSYLAESRVENYTDWVNVGMVLHAISPQLLGAWADWSRKSGKNRTGECESKWKGFTGEGGLKIGSLVEWAKQDSNGAWKPKSKPRISAATAAAVAAGEPLSLLNPADHHGRTDQANAARFAVTNRNSVRYCGPWKKWLIWDGTRWVVDQSERVIGLAKQSVNALWQIGFSDKGISGALTASLGVGFRSARGMVASFAASSITAPFRAGLSVLNGTAAASVASITKVATATTATGAAMARAAAPTRGFGAALASIAGKLSGVFAFVGKVAKVAGTIATAGMVAAGGFAMAASEITAKAKETGQSVQSLIEAKYGKFSFITPPDIAAGDALSQSMKQLKQQTAAAFAQLGIAAMPMLKKTVEFMTNVTAAVTRFLAENRQLVSAIIGTAGKVAKFVGAFILAAPVIGVVGSAMAALMHPAVLAGAAIGAIAFAFPQLRAAAADALSYVGTLFQSALQSATSFFNYLFPNFGQLGGIVSGTMQGVVDAIQGGSLQTAGETAMAGLNLAWLSGSEKLREIYRSVTTDIQVMLTDAYAAVQSGWAVTTAYMQDVWQAATTIFATAMEPITSKMDAIKALWGGITEVATTY